MYSKDVARFIEFVINEWTTIPNIINLGLGYDYSVEEYYHIVSKTLNWSGNFIFDKTKPDGMQNKLLNIDKIKKLNWKTKYSLEQGIMETYTHYFNSFN